MLRSSLALSDGPREASFEEYQCALQRLEEETAALRSTPTTSSRVPVRPDLEEVLDRLRREQAGLVAELHRTRLERQNRAIQGELETEKLLAKLQQAQLDERHQELRSELLRAEQAGRPDVMLPQQEDEDDCSLDISQRAVSDSPSTVSPTSTTFSSTLKSRMGASESGRRLHVSAARGASAESAPDQRM